MARQKFPGNPGPKKIAQELPVKLTGIQLADKKDQLLAADLELNALDASKQGFLVVHNDKVKRVELQKKALLGVLKDGFENKMVDCEERYDFDRNRASIVRLDTGEQVGEERAITGEERTKLAQNELPMSNGEEKRPEA